MNTIDFLKFDSSFILSLWGLNIFIVENLISFISLFVVTGMYFLIRHHNKKVSSSLIRDELTGAYNRRFLEKFDLRGCSVIMVDIDYFKDINDTHGHPFGDFVLQELVSFLKGEVREADKIVRLGGEEFCVILPEAKHSLARKISERIRERIERRTFSDGEVECNFTVSLGFLEVEKENHFQEIYERLDGALYEAKKNGRNICVQA